MKSTEGKRSFDHEAIAKVESNRIGSMQEINEVSILGYKPELHRNRSMLTPLFQSLAIAAIPYGEGAPLLSAIYGGGQLSIFLGWILVLILDECIALSLVELTSRYPTSAGPGYWAFQIASKRSRVVVAFITGWVWLIGNWTITLSVNFGFASLVAGVISMYHPDFVASAWQLLLIFYAITILTFFFCAFGNKFLPAVDTLCAAFTAVSIFIMLIALSAKADVGRHSAAYALGHYDTSLSGWGGFTFFIGLLPPAYCFSALGMITAMSEEVADPAVQVPKALSLCVPVGGLAGLFIIPICCTLPPLADILEAPAAQALPYIFHTVMGSPGGGLGLTFLVLVITLFCSISITVAASRCTWAFARDHAIPWSTFFSKVDTRLKVPVNALVLVTIVQMLLGLINLGSTSAFTAFVSVGVIALAVSYGIPIAVSVLHRRREVAHARWNCSSIFGPKLGEVVGWTVNVVALAWIAFEVVLFSMPTALPVTSITMNYASVVFVGFGALSAIWYFVYARKVYKGPPESDGLSAETE